MGFREVVRGLGSPTPFMESCEGGGGDVKTKFKPFEELFEKHFFSLSLDIFKKRAGVEQNLNLLRIFFQLRFGRFPRKGGSSKIQS